MKLGRLSFLGVLVSSLVVSTVMIGFVACGTGAQAAGLGAHRANAQNGHRVGQPIGSNLLRQILDKNYAGLDFLNKTGAAVMATDSAPLPPIRYAKIRYQIFKETFDKIGDDIGFKRETVCEQTDQVPVFDLRTSDPIKDARPKQFTCSTTLLGKQTDIHLYSEILLDNDFIWENEPKTDLKVFLGILLIPRGDVTHPNKNQDGFDTQGAVNGSSITRGIAADNGILTMVPDAGGYSCSETDENTTKCETNLPEYFWAVAEIEDKQ